MAKGSLAQSMNKLTAACQVIVLQGDRGPDEIDVGSPGGRVRRAFFEYFNPGFSLAGQHRQ
ncbi:hypothetical protein D3C76_1851990 [compost metagenome]